MTRKPAALLLLLLLGGGSGTGIYHYLNRKDPVEKTEPRSNENGNKTPEKTKVKILELVKDYLLPFENSVDAQGGKLSNKAKNGKHKKILGKEIDGEKLKQGCQKQSELEILEDEKENNDDLKKN